MARAGPQMWGLHPSVAGLLATCLGAHPSSFAASVQLWRSRLGRVTCSMANCLLLMKVPFPGGGGPGHSRGRAPVRHASRGARGTPGVHVLQFLLSGTSAECSADTRCCSGSEWGS